MYTAMWSRFQVLQFKEGTFEILADIEYTQFNGIQIMPMFVVKGTIILL